MNFRFIITCIVICLVNNVCSTKISCIKNSSNITVEDFDVQFYLCACKNNECQEEERHCKKIPSGSQINEFLSEHGFDSRRRTTVLVHGFKHSFDVQWVQDMKNALFDWEPMNLILVNWSEVFGNVWSLKYRKAVLSTEKVAVKISELLRNIASATGKPLREWYYLHFIGHSLGAHAVSQAARILTEVEVHRITGLDPANPCFSRGEVELSLKKSDARFVDVIHTNCMENRTTNGLYEPIGHIDFYPNGGKNQPRCGWISRLPSSNAFLVSVTNLLESTWNKFSTDVVTNMAYFGYVETEMDEGEMRSLAETLTERGIPQTICDHEEATYYFIQSLAKNAKKQWGSPLTRLPLQINETLRCMNKACEDNPNCIEMGINAENYLDRIQPSYYYYVDVLGDDINCDNQESPY